MKYYYIRQTGNYSSLFGTSEIGFIVKTLDLEFDQKGYLAYSEPIKLGITGEVGELRLRFSKFEKRYPYILTIIPELKVVFEQFNMPPHKWYQAEAGYNLKYVHNMRRFHNIEYDININEKRDYWVLQILDKNREELALEEMDFNIVDIRNKKSILRSLDTKISTLEQLYDMSRQVHSNSKKNTIIEFIDSPKYIYHKSYDILWAGTKVVFNDKVKTALEATNIITPENGLQFAEFTDYEIEMLGEGV